MLEDTFLTFAVVLALAAAAGLVAARLHQPVIVAFIGVGILVGPVGLGLVVGDEPVDLFAKLGIALLLFLVGLKLDLHLVRSTGPVALATGLGQVVFTSVIGFFIARALGMDVTTAIYVAVALTFSSTIIIVKLLSDKREIDQLHGRIAVGFLIVQDIVVVLAMITLTAIGEAGADSVVTEFALVAAKGAGLLVGMGLLMRFVLPRLLFWFAKVNDLFVIFGVMWAILVAGVTDMLGFSIEVGAFLAGVSLASTPYREAIGARLVSLRDFLLLFFFISLGAQLEFTEAGRQLFEAGILSLFVLVGNPLIVLVIMGLMRYPVRVSFLAGLTVAQISEFSLILAALGLSLGHIDAATLSLITVVGLVTIGTSTYMILYSHQLYERLEWLIHPFQRSRTRDVDEDEGHEVDVILYGLGRLGSGVARGLVAAGRRVVAVDFDPEVAAKWPHDEITVVYGDAEDLDFLETLPLRRSTWVVSTIPDVDTQLTLLHGLRDHEYPGRTAVVAFDDMAAKRLAGGGADVILRPFVDAAGSALEYLLGYEEANEVIDQEPRVESSE